MAVTLRVENDLPFRIGSTSKRIGLVELPGLKNKNVESAVDALLTVR